MDSRPCPSALAKADSGYPRKWHIRRQLRQIFAGSARDGDHQRTLYQFCASSSSCLVLSKRPPNYNRAGRNMARPVLVGLLLGLAGIAAGHGFLKSITVESKNYLAWQVGQDNFLTPTPVRYARKLENNGPVPDFTTKNITYIAPRPREPLV